MFKTYAAKPSEIERKWWLIDAQDLVVGRLSVIIANLLRGKNKPTFTPNQDCGDYVVIINAEKVKFTGKKLAEKKYYWHTGYPGGIKEKTAKDIIKGDHPQRILEKAVSRMISSGPLQRDILKKLYIYSGSEHKHQGQQPENLDVASLNRKNKKA
jgi:large subunit ribosomal protein L13